MNEKISKLFSDRPNNSVNCFRCCGTGRVELSYALAYREDPIEIEGMPDAIHARVYLGSSIFEATKEASEIAHRAQFPVAFVFQDRLVVVRPGDDPDIVARAWWIGARGETPEQTFARR